MTSERDLSGIAAALKLGPRETVLEIGPGTGALTRKLIENGARVLAVEKDRTLATYLEQNIPGDSLQVIPKDILKVDLKKDLHLKAPVPVVGNIPYNITTPILEWMIAQRRWISQAVLTVQWEVARRLAAEPGSKDWGSLSIFLRLYADVELIQKIDKSHFVPAPTVDSGVLRFVFLSEPRHSLTNEALFFSLVRRSFQKRRKTLLNALWDKNTGNPSKEVLRAVFAKLSIEARRRPETLSLGEWVRLSEALCSPSQK